MFYPVSKKYVAFWCKCITWNIMLYLFMIYLLVMYAYPGTHPHTRASMQNGLKINSLELAVLNKVKNVTNYAGNVALFDLISFYSHFVKQ